MERYGRYIPNRLRQYRLISGLTLEQVAQSLGFKNVNRISLWERGEACPSITNLFKLSILYRTLPDELYYDLRQEMRQELAENQRKIAKKHS